MKQRRFGVAEEMHADAQNDKGHPRSACAPLHLRKNESLLKTAAGREFPSGHENDESMAVRAFDSRSASCMISTMLSRFSAAWIVMSTIADADV
jgi:hypothetical protein